LVDGPTLADRLVRGRLSQREALVIAAQIAEALEAAHEAGIVHRDLKSANIKMTSTGGVKVLDFGLAKMLVEEGSRADVSASPTITVAGTRAGVVLGTAAYMSPEQARGAQIDKRADVWAFGCVLFEMLTGRGAFAAETVPDTVVNVLTREPELDSLPSDTSPMVRSLLKRCLHKDQNRRMRDIGDAHFQIEEALTAQAATSVASTLLTGKARRGWAAALVVAAALIATAGVLLRRAPGELPLMRFSLVTPEAPNSFAFALAPDGRSLVYQSQADGQLRLWHREFDRDEAVPLGGTDRGDRPFWSPDSRSVAFFADGALKRIDLGSGFVRIVTAAPNAVRGAWSSEDTVLFGPSVGPLSRVSASGGPVRPATTLQPGQSSHRWPQFLPDGRRFLFLALGTPAARGVFVGSLDSNVITRLVQGQPGFVLLPPSHLLLADQGALWAQKLNRDYTGTEGGMLPVAPKLLSHPAINGLTALSASPGGMVAYRSAAERRQFVWLDRNGRQTGVLTQPDDTQWSNGRLAPDGETFVSMRMVEGNTDVWVIDAGSAPRRLTFDPNVDGEPFFSSDGRRVVYASDPSAGLYDMYERPADGTGAETLLFNAPENENPRDMTPDGRFLLYAKQSPTTDYDLWLLPLAGDRKPYPLVQTPFLEINGKFAPDGRSIASKSASWRPARGTAAGRSHAVRSRMEPGGCRGGGATARRSTTLPRTTV
jgi:Tol biopolymer transport system component